MKINSIKNIFKGICSLALVAMSLNSTMVKASSHREAPLISRDALADNTDLYAFRSPDDTNTVTIIANYIPFEKADGGPNYYGFGENIRYEIHIKNKANTTTDDITYRFTFTKKNEDGSTFFNIRLGKQNIKTTYTLERSINSGTWATIITNGVVPPPNIGPRSIETSVGLGSNYANIMQNAITKAKGNGRETVFCGPIDDPFFVDLGGIFDLGNVRQNGKGSRDAVKKFNCHTIAIKVPISFLQKTNDSIPTSILDPNYVIGVWASASRPRITTLGTNGAEATVSTDYVQVSRLGMPLTNEAIIPVGRKDEWNATNPVNDTAFIKYFTNPELELYMDSAQYAGAVPGLSDSLKIQLRSYTGLGRVNFGIGQKGLYVLKGSSYVKGTALDDAVFGKILLPDAKSPRAVDILPIFYTGVPNLAPYQLATGKTGRNPLAPGKPFINNFLPTLGDMLRLNMAVPVTPRNSKDFSSLGIIAAAASGLLDPRYNTSTKMQFIPNMDGFPNGRRLEDDVTRIELQAVAGVALAAIGLPYDDYRPGTNDTLGWPGTKRLFSVVNFTAGPVQNDTTFTSGFPYVQTPWRGYVGNSVTCTYKDTNTYTGIESINKSLPLGFMKASPNPFSGSTNFDIHLATGGRANLSIYDLNGKLIATPLDQNRTSGDFNQVWNAEGLPSGIYTAVLRVNGIPQKFIKVIVNKN